MTAAPSWEPTDSDTTNLLRLVADDPDYYRFLLCCKAIAASREGRVPVNAVRRLIEAEGIDIDPRRYSAFWNRATSKGGPMVTTSEWEVCDDRKGRNGGKPQRVRRWVA